MKFKQFLNEDIKYWSSVKEKELFSESLQTKIAKKQNLRHLGHGTYYHRAAKKYYYWDKNTKTFQNFNYSENIPIPNTSKTKENIFNFINNLNDSQINSFKKLFTYIKKFNQNDIVFSEEDIKLFKSFPHLPNRENTLIYRGKSMEINDKNFAFYKKMFENNTNFIYQNKHKQFTSWSKKLVVAKEFATKAYKEIFLVLKSKIRKDSVYIDVYGIQENISLISRELMYSNKIKRKCRFLIDILPFSLEQEIIFLGDKVTQTKVIYMGQRYEKNSDTPSQLKIFKPNINNSVVK
jgi:hypothetical protein